MIEIVSADRCTRCDLCIRVCPTNVFDRADDGLPVLARHDDCQTCFQCEAYCPADALFVAPHRTRLADDHPLRDEAVIEERGLFGMYRARVGWAKGVEAPAADDYHSTHI